MGGGFLISPEAAAEKAAAEKAAAERKEADSLYVIGLSERERALVESLSRSAE